jgi:hypothetical protein
MRVAYNEQRDTLFIEISQGTVVRDESVSWNVNVGYTAEGLGEITILDPEERGSYPLRIERVAGDVA